MHSKLWNLSFWNIYFYTPSYNIRRKITSSTGYQKNVSKIVAIRYQTKFGYHCDYYYSKFSTSR